MVAAVEQHCASEQWQKDDGQFIPHPLTWLHQGRWKDEGVTLATIDAPATGHVSPRRAAMEHVAAAVIAAANRGEIKAIP